jgi:hypothetical protein
MRLANLHLALPSFAIVAILDWCPPAPAPNRRAPTPSFLCPRCPRSTSCSLDGLPRVRVRRSRSACATSCGVSRSSSRAPPSSPSRSRPPISRYCSCAFLVPFVSPLFFTRLNLIRLKPHRANLSGGTGGPALPAHSARLRRPHTCVVNTGFRAPNSTSY